MCSSENPTIYLDTRSASSSTGRTSSSWLVAYDLLRKKTPPPPPLKKWTLDLSFGLDRGLNCSTNPHIILSVRMLESKNLLTRVAPGGFNHRSRGAAVCVTGSPAAAVALHRTCSERKIDLKHLHLWHWRSKVLHPPPKNMHTCWP